MSELQSQLEATAERSSQESLLMLNSGFNFRCNISQRSSGVIIMDSCPTI